MTLRELLHRQIDQMNTRELSILESLIGQLNRDGAPEPMENASNPCEEARRLLVGQEGLAQEIIDSREERL